MTHTGATLRGMALSNAERQARWRARHREQARERWRKNQRKLTLGLVRQALRNEHFALPEELAAMPIRWPTEAEIAEGRARNVAKAQARVDRRRARYGGRGDPAQARLLETKVDNP